MVQFDWYRCWPSAAGTPYPTPHVVQHICILWVPVLNLKLSTQLNSQLARVRVPDSYPGYTLSLHSQLATQSMEGRVIHLHKLSDRVSMNLLNTHRLQGTQSTCAYISKQCLLKRSHFLQMWCKHQISINFLGSRCIQGHAVPQRNCLFSCICVVCVLHYGQHKQK